MSHSSAVTKAIEKVVFEYIQTLSSKFNLDKDELQELWSGSVEKPKRKRSPPTKKVETTEKVIKEGPYEEPELILNGSITVSVLTGLCKKHNLSTKGKKSELINRLLNKDENEPLPEPDITEKKTKKVGTVLKSEVIKQLQRNIPTITLKRNKHGNICHEESSLIFDADTRVVIGKQNPDGTKSQLTGDDIETCHKYGFEYELPENLDHAKSKSEKVKIAELDDDDDIIIDEDELIESDFVDDEEVSEEEFEDDKE
jgi:hypothetical protein